MGEAVDLPRDDLLQTDGMTQEQAAVHLLRALEDAELAPRDCVPGQERFDDVPASTGACPGWGDVGEFPTDDLMCLSGALTSNVQGPSALIRGGGTLGEGSGNAGPFVINGRVPPSFSASNIGVRGAR